jgi:hypothetical protein
VALPHFLAAQTRTKVSAAKSNLRNIENGLGMYQVDNNALPAARGVLPDDPFGILADHQLAALTAPVPYLTKDAFRDPFGAVLSQALIPLAGANLPSDGGDFPFPDLPNPGRSFLYIHYPSFASLTRNSRINVHGSAVISLGPDRRDSFGAFAPFTSMAMPPLAASAGYPRPVDTLYDPTNGVVSSGDIPRFSGEVPPVTLP